MWWLRGAPAARAAPASHKRPRWSSEATFGYFDYIESSSDSEGVAPAAASRAAAAPVASAPLRRQRAAPVCHIEEVGTTLATGARVAEAPWASPFAEDLGMLGRYVKAVPVKAYWPCTHYREVLTRTSLCLLCRRRAGPVLALYAAAIVTPTPHQAWAELCSNYVFRVGFWGWFCAQFAKARRSLAAAVRQF